MGSQGVKLPLPSPFQNAWLRMALFLWVPGLFLELASSVKRNGHCHTFQVLLTQVSEGAPSFFVTGELEYYVVVHYNNETNELETSQDWVRSALGSEYLQRKTKEVQGYNEDLKRVLERWIRHYNHTNGIHTIQVHASCDLHGIRVLNYAYDRKDFIVFESQQETWRPVVQQAVLTKQRWDNKKGWNQYLHQYLNEECVDTLTKLNNYSERLYCQQTRPNVSVACQDATDGSTILFCHARDFYPPFINITWKKAGEAVTTGTYSSGILPNADGTYQLWVSVSADPQRGNIKSYACWVWHSSQKGPIIITKPTPIKKADLKPAELPRTFRQYRWLIILSAIFVFVIAVVIWWVYPAARLHLQEHDGEVTVSTQRLAGKF